MSFTFSSILSDTNSSCNLRELPSPPSPQERLKRSRYKATFGVFWLVLKLKNCTRSVLQSALPPMVKKSESPALDHAYLRLKRNTLRPTRERHRLSLSFFLTHSLTANQGAIATVHLGDPTTGSSHRVLKFRCFRGNQGPISTVHL